MAKILFVEDEIKIAELLRDYLLAKQHDVVMIHDGAEASPALPSLRSTLFC